jgi:hypothetical protein
MSHRYVKPGLDKLEKKLIEFGDGKTAVELCREAGFANVSHLAQEFVESPKFRIEKAHGEAELVYVCFNIRPTTQEVLDVFKERCYDLPTEEDALRFAKKFPKEQSVRPIAFLHLEKLWYSDSSFTGGMKLPHVLVLSSSKLRPILTMHQLPGGNDLTLGNWFNIHRFAARVRRV